MNNFKDVPSADLHYIESVIEFFENEDTYSIEFVNSIEDLPDFIQSMLRDVLKIIIKHQNKIKFVLYTIKDFPVLYNLLPDKLQKNEKIVLGIASHIRLYNLPEKLSNDKMFLKKLYLTHPNSVSEEILNQLDINKDELITRIVFDEYYCKYIPKIYLNDREFWVEAAYYNGMSVHFLPIEFWYDREIVVNAVSDNANALKYCVKQFQSDADIVRIAILKDEKSIVYANPDLFKIGADLFEFKDLSFKYGSVYGDFQFKD